MAGSEMLFRRPYSGLYMFALTFLYLITVCAFQSAESPCVTNPCQNNGTCLMVDGQPQCFCAPGFEGNNCDVDIDECASGPCLNGGSCVDEINAFLCFCPTGFGGARCDVLTGSCPPGSTGDQCQESTTNVVGMLCNGPNPCLHEGICIVDASDAQFRCECTAGFTGTRCEVNIDDCANVTCPPNSECVDGIGNHACFCRPGFTGTPPNCENINECESQPCNNGATCFDLEDGYACQCVAGFTGFHCETRASGCAGNPCVHGGICEENETNFTCSCKPGYTGPVCETNIDDCTPNPCLHAINCIDKVAGYECQCEPGWTGPRCDVDIDECQSTPCLNNATCINELNAFVCNCPAGFTGSRCEINIDDCVNHTCQNGATCVDGVGGYNCSCPDNFMGPKCELPYDACALSPCFNGASCITTPPSHDYYCECLRGFEGLNCENNIDECYSVQCSEGKVCVDLVNGYECRCPVGFTGELCQTNIDDCASNPCANGATCLDGIANYSCACPPGYTGKNCEEDIDECSLLRPCIFGICQNTNGSYQCYCRPGFSGTNCNLEFDECLSHPCLNNGTCNNLINGYECFCAPGFTGKDCDININECESNPCQNKATCVDGIASYQCLCKPGFTGSRCEINIDECESAPCLNGGMCIDGIDSFTCDCTDTGFTGLTCEINVDDCESAPCVHGSRCEDLVKDYRCHCFGGYEGKNCEIDVNECDASPCRNGATCLEKSNQKLYDMGIFAEPFSYNTSGGYSCQCLPGYEGTNCEIDIDECQLILATNPRPCRFGNCVDGVNNYSCSCWPGYEGDACETEIDECARFEPCVHGTCVDKIADYQCICPPNWGGKNCSVELLGCINLECSNGGTCMPFLENETIHDFKCLCKHGFHGRLCDQVTTMSFNGSSFYPVQTQREEGYELSFRFRTTLPNGLLAVGQGQTYYRLELLEGQLNLHSSLLNRWEGVFVSSRLNDDSWQAVRVKFNYTHLLIGVNSDEAVYPINPVESINSTETSFGMTVLGGATSTLRILAQGLPYFVGCMEDVVVNGQWVIPGSSNGAVGVAKGCPREEQCQPNPCMNGGVCRDLWTFFNCSCVRPYLGDTCEFSFQAATFGHENTTNSMVTVNIAPQERLALSNSMDISMFVRTREPEGLVFYLGSTPAQTQTTPSFIATEIHEGKLMVVANFGDMEQVFPVQGITVQDGYSHLVQVTRDRLQVTVRVNGTLYLNETLVALRTLNAEVLYLGGLPTTERTRRQTLSSQIASGVLTGKSFKGIIQDVQVRSGNVSRVVEIFPLEEPSVALALPPPLGQIERNDVLPGEVSDDSCRDSPCQNGGNCTVTWNDFSCACPLGFKGKTCGELAFCSIYQCPESSTCQNLEDGYECIAPATFNGANASLQYDALGEGFETVPLTLSFDYRSRKGGVIMHLQENGQFVLVRATDQGMVVQWQFGTEAKQATFGTDVLDSQWHSVTISFVQNTTASFDQQVTQLTILEADQFLGQLKQEISLGKLATTVSETATVAPDMDTPLNSDFFRGCLNHVRIGGILLPFFPAGLLANNTAAQQFSMESGNAESVTGFVEVGCRLCYEHECQHESTCANPEESFVCSCQTGFEGDFCEIDIDECQNSLCVNGTCVDRIGNYTCDCQVGYTGWLCDEDINECSSNPCVNNGTCMNLIGKYECVCPEGFVGINCEKRRNCEDHPCVHGDCQNVVHNETGELIDYTCSCPFNYEGPNCDNEIDFCSQAPCANGGTCMKHDTEPGYKCLCMPGYTGPQCQKDIDECASSPCQFGASCEDKVNGYTCHCTQFSTGVNCEQDIDECKQDANRCGSNADCINLIGTGNDCRCKAKYCGVNCEVDDPCFISNGTDCQNGGTCMPLCDDRTASVGNYTCLCPQGYSGMHCESHFGEQEGGLDLAAIIIPIVAAMLIIALAGTVAFVMTARKKRATRGTYSPSRQEMFSPRVEMGQVMKPPPEERLI